MSKSRGELKKSKKLLEGVRFKESKVTASLLKRIAGAMLYHALVRGERIPDPRLSDWLGPG